MHGMTKSHHSLAIQCMISGSNKLQWFEFSERLLAQVIWFDVTDSIK